MTVHSFPTGDPYWFDVETPTLALSYDFIPILGTWSPNRVTEVFVSDIISNAPTDPSWDRVSLTGATITVDLDLGFTIVSTSINPDFGEPEGGETAIWLALAANIANDDAQSVLMSAYSVNHVADGTPYAPDVNVAGLYVVRRS